MEEEKKVMDWLRGQKMEIPIEDYISMRLELAKERQENIKIGAENWDIKEELKKTQAILAETKKELRKVLGIEKEEGE